jgi:hypothetical protein
MPDGWQELAAAVREVRDQIRESFGPRVEVREIGGMVLRGMAEDLDQVRELKFEPTDAERFGGHGELICREDLEAMEQPAARVGRLKREVRDRVLELCGWEDGAETTASGSQDNDLAAERADAVMAFLGLARGHSLPNKLLPRGEHPGDWLTPGTEVTVLGRHPAVVMPRRDMVTVKLEGSDVVTEFPRMSITKRGEAWTPPKRTDD